MAETEMEVIIIPKMRGKDSQTEVLVSKKSYDLDIVPETKMEDQNLSEDELELFKAAKNGDKSKVQELLDK